MQMTVKELSDALLKLVEDGQGGFLVSAVETGDKEEPTGQTIVEQVVLGDDSDEVFLFETTGLHAEEESNNLRKANRCN